MPDVKREHHKQDNVQNYCANAGKCERERKGNEIGQGIRQGHEQMDQPLMLKIVDLRVGETVLMMRREPSSMPAQISRRGAMRK